MLRYKGISWLEYWKLKRIARQVRAGIVPDGVDPETILRAMKLTKPKNVLEILGLLQAKVQRKDGTFKDYGLVSVKQVTTVFAEYLVDALIDSTVDMDTFTYHKMGADSSAEAADQTALIDQQDGAQTGSTGEPAATHGAQDSIFVTIGTLTSDSIYGVREHGIFNASTNGVLLDRSLVDNIEVAVDDIITWTYELTVTPGG